MKIQPLKNRDCKIRKKGKTNRNQRKKKRNNIKYTISTSSEDVVFSIHSDSDLDGIDISLDNENRIDDEDDETVKRNIDERESKIFQEIRELDETINTEQDLNKKKNKYEKKNTITLKNDAENKIETLYSLDIIPGKHGNTILALLLKSKQQCK